VVEGYFGTIRLFGSLRVPTVEEVQSFGKRVQCVGTPKGQSYGLSKVADDVRLIRPEDVRPFFEPRS
jgi:uncharacterized LabA/DUF88 family protein